MRRMWTITRRQGLWSMPLLAALACGGGDLTLPADPSPAELLRVSGNQQSAPPGDQLPEPLVVRLVDEHGAGVRSAPVTWVVGAGGGEVSPATVVTDSQGLASATLTLGPDQGENLVSAVVSGLEAVNFTASAEHGRGGGEGSLPHHLVFLVQPSDVEEEERFQPPVAVAVVDESGRIVPEPKMRIQVALGGGWARLGGKREADTKDGIATFDDLEVEDSGDGLFLRAFAPKALFLGFVQSDPFTVRED